jgi:hypothetical protein
MKIKLLFCCFLCCIVLQLPAQIFVRVFDADGVKIGRGRVLNVKESELQLTASSGDTLRIPAAKIATIKTKHSLGHTILWGAAIGSPLIGFFAAVTAPGDNTGGGYSGFKSPAFQGIVGAFLGAPVGAMWGAFFAIFKKQDEFAINGDAVKLQQYRQQLMRQ